MSENDPHSEEIGNERAETPDSLKGFPPPIPGKVTSLATTMDALLKRPLVVLSELQGGKTRAVGLHLMVIALVCLGVFGVILGMCSGDGQLWRAPLKIILGVAVSGLITLPSLYIFSCLNGLDVSLKLIAAVLGSCLALVSLLLIGLSPVLWVFTQSTESLVFVGFLTAIFWMGALSFGFSLLLKMASYSGAEKKGYLHLWGLIFVIVTFQMSTALRPLIGEADSFLPEEKKFFLDHWLDQTADRQDVESKQG